MSKLICYLTEHKIVKPEIKWSKSEYHWISEAIINVEHV